MKIAFCQCTFRRDWERTLKHIEMWLPYVDYVIIVVDETVPPEEVKEAEKKFNSPKLIIKQVRFEDDIPRFRNVYMEECERLGVDWIVVSDPDETFNDAFRKDIRRIVELLESRGYNIAGINCREQFEDIEWLDELDLLKECFDDETEILTRNGWKRFKDVSFNDEVYTLNLRKGVAEYQRPVKIVHFRYRGKVILHETPRINFCVTPNHRMLVKKHHDRYYEPKTDWNRVSKYEKAITLHKKGLGHCRLSKLLGIPAGTIYYWLHKGVKPWRKREKDPYYVIPAKEVLKRTNLLYLRGGFPYAGERKETFILPTDENIKIPMDDWLAFFGFWLGDGWTYKKRTGEYIVGISQKKKKEFVEAILRKLPFNFCRYRREEKADDYVIFNKSLYLYMKRFGKTGERFIPEEFKDLAPDQLKILLDSFIQAEGWRNGDGWQVGVKGKRLADDIQEIALKIGYAATVTEREKDFYIITISRNVKINSRGTKEADYDGYVHCVTVPNSFIMVRRKGRPLWAGNSPGGYRESTFYKNLLFKMRPGLRYVGVGIGRVHETWNIQGGWRAIHLPKEKYWYVHRKSALDIYRNAARNMVIAGGSDNVGELNPYWKPLRQLMEKYGIRGWTELEHKVVSGDIPEELAQYILKLLDAPNNDWGRECRQTAKWFLWYNRKYLTPEIENKIKHPPPPTREQRIIDAVRKVYFKVLGRHPDREGLEYWARQVLEGRVKLEDLPRILMSSTERREKFAWQQESIKIQVPVDVNIRLDEDSILIALMNSRAWNEKLKPRLDFAKAVEEFVRDKEQFYKEFYNLKNLGGLNAKALIKLIEEHIVH